jgi:hypothetical protein
MSKAEIHKMLFAYRSPKSNVKSVVLSEEGEAWMCEQIMYSVGIQDPVAARAVLVRCSAGSKRAPRVGRILFVHFAWPCNRTKWHSLSGAALAA